jgi:hypothetical protein
VRRSNRTDCRCRGDRHPDRHEGHEADTKHTQETDAHPKWMMAPPMS